MRIAMVSPYFHPVIGGIETYVLELSREFVNKDHEVYVFTSNKTMDGKYDVFPWQEEINGINIFRFKVLPFTKGVEFWLKFSDTLLKAKPDIVHCHKIGFSMSDMCPIICKANRIPSIATTHGVPYISSVHREPPLRDLYLKTVPGRTVRLFDHIVAISEIELPWLHKSGVSDEKIHVIPGGVSRRIFNGNFSERDFREKYDVESRMILYLGRLADKKGIEHLIYAAPLLLRDFPDLKIVIAGPDCGMMGRLMNLTHKLGVERSVIFTGPLPEEYKYAALASSEALILPSSFEAQGLVLMEAQALGIPVIATKQGGVPYFIRDGVNGILIDYGRPDQIVKAVKTILEDRDLARRMGENGRRLAEKHTWDSIANKMLTIYEDMANASAKNVVSSAS